MIDIIKTINSVATNILELRLELIVLTTRVTSALGEKRGRLCS